MDGWDRIRIHTCIHRFMQLLFDKNLVLSKNFFICSEDGKTENRITKIEEFNS